MVPQNANIFTNDPTTGTMTPTINQTITGGLSPVQNSLMIAANLHTNSNLTVQISFTSVPLGATDVSFTIFDIDVSTNADIIDSIYGVAPDGTHIAATISFGSTIITDVFFTFSNTAGAPRYQDIGIGDLTFTPVPEINPALAASLSCCAAVGLTVFLKRRAARRAACQAA